MSDRTKAILWFVAAILAILFAMYSCAFGPDVQPPQSMKSGDPYWYSGE